MNKYPINKNNRKRKGLLLWIKIEKQVHSFLYQNQLIASGYIVNFSRDNRLREVGVKIKNHKTHKGVIKCLEMEFQ